MNRKRQIHDGIAGGLITLGVLLGMYVNPAWLWLPGILGVTLQQSGFTSFASPITSCIKPVWRSNVGYPKMQKWAGS